MLAFFREKDFGVNLGTQLSAIERIRHSIAFLFGGLVEQFVFLILRRRPIKQGNSRK
jgi:hypothetical protein